MTSIGTAIASVGLTVGVLGILGYVVWHLKDMWNRS